MSDNKIRRFEKVDWYGWAGAERFPNGHEPFIYIRDIDDNVGVTMIGDANGIGITLYDDSSETGDGMLNWYFERKMPELIVKGHMEAMIEEFKIDETFDAAKLCYELDTTNKWRFEFCEG